VVVVVEHVLVIGMSWQALVGGTNPVTVMHSDARHP